MKMNRVDEARLKRVIAAAQGSPRRRMNDNLHQMQDGIHRLLNATEPSTYVRPHRHAQPAITETLCVLSGRGAILTFDDRGECLERAVLSNSDGCRVAEIPPATWHTLIALESGTVWFEVKAGPYVPIPAEDLAPWAPAPESDSAAAYLRSLRAIALAPD
jgi:cupin fold WbuC family metalloprotein